MLLKVNSELGTTLVWNPQTQQFRLQTTQSVEFLRRWEEILCHIEANLVVLGERHINMSHRPHTHSHGDFGDDNKRDNNRLSFLGVFLLCVSFMQRRTTFKHWWLQMTNAFRTTKVGSAQLGESVWSVAACLPTTRRLPQSFLSKAHYSEITALTLRKRRPSGTESASPQQFGFHLYLQWQTPPVIPAALPCI